MPRSTPTEIAKLLIDGHYRSILVSNLKTSHAVIKEVERLTAKAKEAETHITFLGNIYVRLKK